MSSPFKTAWAVARAAHKQGGPDLLTNPAGDERFRADALSAVHTHVTPAGLEAALRPRYPHIAVHVRSLVHEPFVVWYVYRDGRWLSRDEGAASTDERSRPGRGGPEGDL